MHRWFGLLCVSATLASITVAAAEKTPSAEQSPIRSGVAHDVGKTKKRPKATTAFTPAREAAAMAFVGRNHPELADLLAHLKKTEAAEYKRAIGALFRASEHLAQIQKRNPEHYERELKAWKLKSRIQLLVAQLRIAPEDEKLRRELKQALTAQADLRGARLVEERKRLAERLKKLDGVIERAQKDRDSQVEKQLDILLRQKAKRGALDRRDGGRKKSAGRGPNARPTEAPELPKKPPRATSPPNP